MPFQFTDNGLSQSLDISLSLTNNAGQEYANSDDLNWFHFFTVTVNQLEGEISIPYQFINEISQSTVDDMTVETVIRKLIVSNSVLGGFAKFKVNYSFIEYPAAGETADQGTVVVGDYDTERITVPQYFIPPPPPPETFTFDINQIREAFADKIYHSFFQSSEIPGDLGDIKTLQTTIRDGFITTGRQSEDEKLVFFKKDRNTPENAKDFSEGMIDTIITDISASISDDGTTGFVDLATFLDDEVTILPPVISDRQVFMTIAEDGTTEIPLYYFITTTYKLQYKNTSMEVPFAEYNTFYANDITDDPYIDPETQEAKPIEWTNILNLSQLTVPKLGTRTSKEKAKEILDTTIFELLPTQRTRQNEIDEFFVDFNEMIGPAPVFDDVDNDNAGEVIQDSQENIRISTAPTNPSSYITRIDGEANEVNVNKTLESMRNRLNQYLGDVDNVVEEIQDERPEYENKSEGFLKIRKPNQAIIISDINGGELEFQKNDSFLTDGFTITQWVRFVGKTGRGTLFSFGNPYKIESRYGFRLETITMLDNQDIHRRMVRLVVWDHIQNKLYDSNIPGIGNRDRYNTVLNDAVAYRLGSTDSRFWDHAIIPTDDLNEWYFICATYDPTIDEDDSFLYAEENNFLKNKQFWLGHYTVPDPSINSQGTYIGDNQIEVSAGDSDIFGNLVVSNIGSTISTDGPPIQFSGSVTNFVNSIIDFDTTFDTSVLVDNTTVNFIINYPQGIYVSRSGYGARCKVEVISRSELLRARGYKVDKFDIPLE